MGVQVRQGYEPGCIGRIVELHANYYHALTGFGLHFESKVARELAMFCERYQEGADGLWLAVQDGRVEGSIAIDGSHAAQDGAHLRWFITSDRVRGAGMGKTLLARAMEFCQACAYEKVYLWTFDGLAAARHLYESQGFKLVYEQPGSQWGEEVREQRFEWGQP